MIDYETYCKIHDAHAREGLSIVQIAQSLQLHPETVSKWLRVSHFHPRQPTRRSSQLDAFKA